jgi:hypothetical protein
MTSGQADPEASVQGPIKRSRSGRRSHQEQHTASLCAQQVCIAYKTCSGIPSANKRRPPLGGEEAVALAAQRTGDAFRCSGHRLRGTARPGTGSWGNTQIQAIQRSVPIGDESAI